MTYANSSGRKYGIRGKRACYPGSTPVLRKGLVFCAGTVQAMAVSSPGMHIRDLGMQRPCYSAVLTSLETGVEHRSASAKLPKEQSAGRIRRICNIAPAGARAAVSEINTVQ